MFCPQQPLGKPTAILATLMRFLNTFWSQSIGESIDSSATTLVISGPLATYLCANNCALKGATAASALSIKTAKSVSPYSCILLGVWTSLLWASTTWEFGHLPNRWTHLSQSTQDKVLLAVVQNSGHVFPNRLAGGDGVEKLDSSVVHAEAKLRMAARQTVICKRRFPAPFTRIH